MAEYRTQVRFPNRTLADDVKALAKQQQRSMNAQIIKLIQKGLEDAQKTA